MNKRQTLGRLRLAGALMVFVVFLPVESKAVVCNNVRVQASNLSFGNYSAASPTADTATTNIRVRCQGGGANTLPPFTLDLSTGSSGSYLPRKMFRLLVPLSYNLYLTAAYATVWGNGTGGTGNVAHAGGVNSIDFTVYGRIPAGQYVNAGNYSDSITATVTY